MMSQKSKGFGKHGHCEEFPEVENVETSEETMFQ